MSDNDIVETSSAWEAVSNSLSEPYNRQLSGDLMTASREQIDRFGWFQTNFTCTVPRRELPATPTGGATRLPAGMTDGSLNRNEGRIKVVQYSARIACSIPEVCRSRPRSVRFPGCTSLHWHPLPHRAIHRVASPHAEDLAPFECRSGGGCVSRLMWHRRVFEPTRRER